MPVAANLQQAADFAQENVQAQFFIAEDLRALLDQFVQGPSEPDQNEDEERSE